MVQRDIPIPFGLHFMEDVTEEATNQVPFYDEDTDMSYVEDSEGRRMPFVELKVASGTETSTEIRVEGTDHDALPEGFAGGTLRRQGPWKQAMMIGRISR